MSVDFPRAWQITLATPKADHHEKCGYRTHGTLCDCDVLMRHPEVLAPQGLVANHASPSSLGLGTR